MCSSNRDEKNEMSMDKTGKQFEKLTKKGKKCFIIFFFRMKMYKGKNLNDSERKYFLFEYSCTSKWIIIVLYVIN